MVTMSINALNQKLLHTLLAASAYVMIRNKKAYILANSENKYGAFCAGSKWKKNIGFRW